MSLKDWQGLIAKRPAEADVVLDMALQQSKAGGSGAFLAAGNDGLRYWVKTLNNGQGERVPATEQIIGRVGSLIEA